MTENVLVGKTLTGIQLAEDKEAIRFVTTDGDVIARCDADCCSHTWVEHIELPALGFPAVVLAVEDIALAPDEWRDGDLVQHYGCKITTDRGEIIIDYRNESNGYYGGNLSWPSDRYYYYWPSDRYYYYGGVHGQNVSAQKWVDL